MLTELCLAVVSLDYCIPMIVLLFLKPFLSASSLVDHFVKGKVAHRDMTLLCTHFTCYFL